MVLLNNSTDVNQKELVILHSYFCRYIIGVYMYVMYIQCCMNNELKLEGPDL